MSLNKKLYESSFFEVFRQCFSTELIWVSVEGLYIPFKSPPEAHPQDTADDCGVIGLWMLLHSSDFERSVLCSRSQTSAAERGTLKSSDGIRCVCACCSGTGECFPLPFNEISWLHGFDCFLWLIQVFKAFIFWMSTRRNERLFDRASFCSFTTRLHFLIAILPCLKICTRVSLQHFALSVDVFARQITSVYCNVFHFERISLFLLKFFIYGSLLWGL